MEKESKQNRKWQNLLYKKCPNCDEKLEDVGRYLRCPNIRPDKSQCFLISLLNAGKFLLDPLHPANLNLTDKERDNLMETINNWVSQ